MNRVQKQTLFPMDLVPLQWSEFHASGYKIPVSGVVYPGEKPATCGMPLGGLDTGCIDLGTTGLLGFVTSFNSLSPRRGPLNEPFLGLRLGKKTYVLAGSGMVGVGAAQQMYYWGHYPVADIEYELDCPLGVGVRAWSPFIPGDVDSSMIPGAVFEVHLRNLSAEMQDGRLAMTFAGFERNYTSIYRKPLSNGAFSGAYAGHGKPDRPMSKEASYALGVIGDMPVYLDYHFGWDASAWQRMGDRTVPPMQKDDDNSGMSVAVDFSLEAGEEKVVRFILAWYAPVWYGNGTRTSGGNSYTHMYARNFPDVVSVVQYLAEHHKQLLRRVISWQEVIYAENSLPSWLRDSLINILHLIPETSVWAQAEPPIGDWCQPEDGLFGLNECPRGCPQIECLPCSFYGNLPVVYFFPEAALSTLRGYKAYQYEDGRPAWVFGGITDNGKGYYEMALPAKGYQQSLNGCCIVEMVDKLWLRTGDFQVLSELYDLCKQATIYTMTLRPSYGDRQVIAMPDGDVGTEWFEAEHPGWSGMATHLGGIRLSHLLMMKRMAETVGDTQFAQRCQQWFDAGAEAMEKFLWVDEKGYYLNFYEPESGKKSELVFGYQLDGQWIARFHATTDAFPEQRVQTVLKTIERCNIANSQSGATNYANIDGSVAPVGGYGAYSYFPPELLMLAMTYMYHGDKALGEELARRCWENIVCKQRLTWDQPNFFRGDSDTGERDFGNDYYQNMMLWSLPAALEGKDLAGVCQPGGLVARVIEAGKKD